MNPVAVLAGGLATRLGVLTRALPKSLLEVAGKPFIHHQLELLASRGVERVVLCVGHLGESIRDAVGDGRPWGLSVAYSFDGERLLGTGGALRRAAALLDDTFFVIYGDSYLDADFAPIELAFGEAGKAGLMTVVRNQNRWDASNVLFRDGRIQLYDKVNRPAEMEHIDWGLGVLERRALLDYPADEPVDLATVYRDLLARDQLAGYEVSNRFYEIGSTVGIQETEAYLRQTGRATPVRAS